MKILLIVDSDTSYSSCCSLLQTTGADCIRYRNPIKAMDNIEEISPDFMVIHAGEFPRHWKTLAQFAACCGFVSGLRTILITNKLFSAEEQKKAAELGISTFIDDPAEMRDVSAIQTSLYSTICGTGHCIPKESGTAAQQSTTAAVHDAITPADTSSLQPSFILPSQKTVLCLFTNPLTGAIVTGTVETISAESFSFLPDTPSLISGIERETQISDSTIKIDGSIITPALSVTPSGRTIQCSITSITADDKKCLETYLKTLES